MPRHPKPWFREQTRSWYVKINGVQHPLGRHTGPDVPKKDDRGDWHPPKEVEKAWHRLMSGEGLEVPSKDLTLPGLVAEFLADAALTCTPETVQWYGAFLNDFADRFPKLKPQDVAETHVRRWLAAERRRPWGPTTHRAAITVLKRLLNWAVKNHRKSVLVNPIASMERPAAARRERVLAVGEWAEILSWYPPGDPFRDFLVAIRESGVRPGEVMKVTAADVNFELGVWVIQGKTTKRTGKARVVYMTETLRELTVRLVALHPEGPLFRNEDGNPWNRQAVRDRFRRKQKSKGLDPKVVAYTFRHTWATDALEAGVPDATVAELMGHSGTAMLHKHYSKLREKREHLKRAAEQAVRKKDSK